MQSGNIKFVAYNDSGSAKAPQETMTKGRVYVTINKSDEPTSITYYDKTGNRTKTIDMKHDHNELKGEHAHHGYNHNENDGKKGATRLNPKEKRMVERIKKIWYNHTNS